jgi:hypothetical protein
MERDSMMFFWRLHKIHNRYLMVVLQKKSFRHASNNGRIAELSVLAPKRSTLKVI